MSRRPISDEQRAALRRWFYNQNPRPRQSEAAVWFESQYNHRITQSTVSDSLSNKFSHLDTHLKTPSTISSSSYRNRPAQWPILEAALFEWQQRVEMNGGVVTGDILLEKAQEIWPLIPQYQSQSPPSFSSGWLDNFKKRHNMKKRTKQISAPSFHQIIQPTPKMVQEICESYAEDDIFSIIQTGLFWRMEPSKDYNRSIITLLCCVNHTGGEKLPLWIIGDLKLAHELGGVNLPNIGCQWRSNSQASLDDTIASEWLRAFSASIRPDRYVILLLDSSTMQNFGTELALLPPNIRIQCLPREDTTTYHPLRHGVVSTLKNHYRKYWLASMVQRLEQSTEFSEPVDFYSATYWLTRAWHFDIDLSTIYYSFTRSNIRRHQDPVTLLLKIPPELPFLYDIIQKAGKFQNMMTLPEFLHPDGEDPPNMEDQHGQVSESQDTDIYNIVRALIDNEIQPFHAAED